MLGIAPDQPEKLFRMVGYCTQFDSFPKGLTGYQFIYSYLRLHGWQHAECRKRALEALERVGMAEAADRPVAAYSKGMRQRVKLAQAIAHSPAGAGARRAAQRPRPHGARRNHRALPQWGAEGRTSSSPATSCTKWTASPTRSILLSHGYVVAEGQIQGVRSEVKDQPMQILVRCDRPDLLASRLFEQDHVVEARIHDDGRGLLVRTRDADSFYLLLNRVVMEAGLEVESVAPADDDVNSVYQYLIGSEGGTA